MGCNDSKSIKRDFNGSSFAQTNKSTTYESTYRPKDNRNETPQQNRSGTASGLARFYEDLEDMYQECNRDYKRFIRAIEERVSQIYMEISRQTLSDMNHDEIGAEQSKIIISEEILSLNLNILKVIGRSHNFDYDKEIFKSLNKFQNNLVGYLKTKYPRGQQTFVSGDLMNHFKEFDRVNDLEYDILKNSHTYFGEAEDQRIIIGIKHFVNNLMKECDSNFPGFEKLMQDRAFFIKNEKGQRVTLNYKIGRKIPENAPKYEKFDSSVLEVTSPQIFRVLIKWMEDLEDTIFKTSEKISKKQSFKCYVGEKTQNANDPNLNEKNEKELLFDYINEYEYSEIVNKLVEKIQDLQPKLTQKNKEFVGQLDEFNERLLKILNQADPRQKYVPTKEIETIKYSSFNAKFVEFILTEKLVYTIKQLIKVGKMFVSEYMMNLDIIKFRVTDLMRCQVSGNKKEILQVYKNFQKLQEQEKIEIIKIKNRLSTPLNDAMLIFVIKNSWIICEAQLILSDGGDKADKKSKNTELVNHYFYELERSPYGIMAEIAVLLTYKDSKISYENKITFNESNVDIEKCRKEHGQAVKEQQQQRVPFICSRCSGFYSKFQNLFKLYQCQKCEITICSKCILRKNPDLETLFIMRDISRELQQKIDMLEKTKKQKMRTKNKEGKNPIDKGMMAKEEKDNKAISKKLTPKVVLELFPRQRRIKLKEALDGDKKKEGIRTVKAVKLMEFFASQFKFNKETQGCYFVYVDFRRGEASFKLYDFAPKDDEIINSFDPREKYDENSNFSYSDYDMLMILDENYELKKEDAIKDKHLFLLGARKDLEAKINQIKKQKTEGKINKDDKYKIISVQIPDSPNELVLDYALEGKQKKNQSDDDEYEGNYSDDEQKKDFKYQSLAVLGDRLPALKSARTTIEFDDLGIETKHLDYFKDLGWRHSIKELKITQNKIEDMSVIFDSLNCLQRLYFNKNWVKELKFNKSLPHLQILNGTQNSICSIQGLSNIPNIRKLLLGRNKFKEFPKCKDLKKLNVLNLSENHLSDISNVLKTQFPELQQLIINSQRQQYEQYNEEASVNQSSDNPWLFELFGKKKKSLEMVIEYPKLKNFQSQDNQDLLSGGEITFVSDSLEKISMPSCSIETVIFQRPSCLENLKYLHLNENKIKYFTFLGQKQVRHRRFNKEPSMSEQFKQDIKPISNENLIELNLASNLIEQLPIMKFYALKKLYLMDNHIKSIQQLKQSKLPQLEELDLGINKFTQMCELSLPKLRTLYLNRNQQLRKADLIFTDSHLPALELLCLNSSVGLELSLNRNPSNNPLQKLKTLSIFNTIFRNSDNSNTQLYIPSLQSIQFQGSSFVFFPILNLPNVKKLSLKYLKSKNFKNLQVSKLPQLTELELADLQQGTEGIDKPHQIIADNKKTSTTDINKRLACAFTFPKLKNLKIVRCRISSLKGLEAKSFQSLDCLQIENNTTLDGKIPKLKMPDLTYLQCEKFKLCNCDALISKDLKKLKTLKLSKCEIESISDQTLANLTELTTLILSSNRIQKFNCSKNLDQLTTLDLSNNKLTSFPRIKAKRLTEINWQGNMFFDLLQLQSCELPALETLILKDCNFRKTGLPKLYLPSLESLQITRCHLANISKLSKSHLPSLRSLNLSYNEIQIFPSINLPQLDELLLERNKLDDLTFLKSSNIQGLNTLRLNENMFKAIPEQQFAHLKVFECSNVVLTVLPVLEMPQIEQITINYAKLSNISDFAQGEYKFLKRLDLSYNQIKVLPRFYLQSLTEITLYNNVLDDVSEFFSSHETLSELAIISLESNNIETLPNILFSNLEELDVSSNPLTEFTALVLPEYPMLTHLYLQYTKIEKVALPKLPNLQQICLSSSQVQDLNWLINAAPFLPKLEELDLENCKIIKIPNLQALKSLNSLNLASNPITNVDGLLSGLSNQKIKYLDIYLDISGKDFQKIKAKILQRNPSAQVDNFQQQSENSPPIQQ